MSDLRNSWYMASYVDELEDGGSTAGFLLGLSGPLAGIAAGQPRACSNALSSSAHPAVPPSWGYVPIAAKPSDGGILAATFERKGAQDAERAHRDATYGQTVRGDNP